MSAPQDLRDLLDDPPEEELAPLERADRLLRSVDGPPELPFRLWPAVNRAARRRRPRARRRPAYRVLALAAAFVAAGFAIGYLVAGPNDSPSRDVFDQITLDATRNAPAGATMDIDVLPIDEAGNWALLTQVSGLPPLAEGEQYELWLTQDGHTAASCGRFVVDDAGEAGNVWLNAPYAFRDFDDWVVVRRSPDGEQSPALLAGPVTAPA